MKICHHRFCRGCHFVLPHFLLELPSHVMDVKRIGMSVSPSVVGPLRSIKLVGVCRSFAHRKHPLPPFCLLEFSSRSCAFDRNFWFWRWVFQRNFATGSDVQTQSRLSCEVLLLDPAKLVAWRGICQGLWRGIVGAYDSRAAQKLRMGFAGSLILSLIPRKT